MKQLLYKLAGATALSAVWTLGASAAGHGTQMNTWQGDRGAPSSYSQDQHQSQSDDYQETTYTKPDSHRDYQQPVQHESYKPDVKNDDSNYGKTDGYQKHDIKKFNDYQTVKYEQPTRHEQPSKIYVKESNYKPQTVSYSDRDTDKKDYRNNDNYRPVVYTRTDERSSERDSHKDYKTVHNDCDHHRMTPVAYTFVHHTAPVHYASALHYTSSNFCDRAVRTNSWNFNACGTSMHRATSYFRA
jgi:hypothetical protein